MKRQHDRSTTRIPEGNADRCAHGREHRRVHGRGAASGAPAGPGRGIPTAATPILFVFFLVLVLVMFSACEDPVGSILGSNRPGNVEASTGDYANLVEITWSGVADREDADGDPIRVVGYNLRREDSEGAIADAYSSGTGTTYSDTSATPGVSYSYRVQAVFSDGLTGDWSMEATGYALVTTDLSVYSEPNASSGNRAFDATTGDAWFNFVAQKGWRYRIEVGDTAVTEVALFRKGNIEMELPVGETDEEAYYASTPATDIYHVRVSGGSGTVNVSHR